MEKMTKRIFNIGMERLERIFNQGKPLKETVRNEYFTAFCYDKPQVFEDAVQSVIETFKPFPSELFPSVATIKIATLKVVDEDEEEVRHEPESPQGQDTQEQNFCERCQNRGFYLNQEGVAHFCDCTKGRLRQAAWGVGTADRKRQEKIQRTLDRLPPSSGPVHGLCERNPAGFWEPTKEEHEKWMTAERKKIAEMDVRRIKDKDSRKKGVVPLGSIKRLVEEKIRQVRSNMSSLDREVEDDPFERRGQLSEGGKP